MGDLARVMGALDPALAAWLDAHGPMVLRLLEHLRRERWAHEHDETERRAARVEHGEDIGELRHRRDLALVAWASAC